MIKVEPFGRALFVFTNKEPDRVKMFYWDGTRASGCWRCAWRRAGSPGRKAAGADPQKLSLHPEALTLLLGGLKDGLEKRGRRKILRGKD